MVRLRSSGTSSSAENCTTTATSEIEQQRLGEAVAAEQEDRADQADPDRDRIGRDHPHRRRVPHRALVDRQRGGIDRHLHQIHDAADHLPDDGGDGGGGEPARDGTVRDDRGPWHLLPQMTRQTASRRGDCARGRGALMLTQRATSGQALRHAPSHRRHRRPSQCRQVDPVQSPGRKARRAGRRSPRRDPRPARGRGRIARASNSG